MVQMKDLDCENKQSYWEKKEKKKESISSMAGNGFNISSYLTLLINTVIFC